MPIISFGQETNQIENYYNWFDNAIGKTNSGIYKGIEYFEKYRMLNEKHKFFINPNFTKGSVVFDEQPFFNLDLKYDLFEDQLILRQVNAPNFPTILLDKNRISRFSIGGHDFQKVEFELKKELKINGFYELLINNDILKLYKKYHKRILKRTNNNIQYFEFIDQNSYILFYNNLYYQIYNLNRLSRIFPEFKNQIKSLESKYKSLKKETPDKYLKAVLEDIIFSIQNQN